MLVLRGAKAGAQASRGTRCPLRPARGHSLPARAFGVILRAGRRPTVLFPGRVEAASFLSATDSKT